MNILERDARFRRGRDGTVISIGCFSECWDSRNRHDTKNLIISLLPFGNKIQLATKRFVAYDDLLPIVSSSNWAGQLKVYVSSATISNWSQWERGTTAPMKRFESFESCSKAGITAYLYVKPVIPGVTIADVENYGSIMAQFSVSAIVGEQFSTQSAAGIAPISKGLFVAVHDDVALMREKLSKFGSVYANSTDTL